MFWREIRSNARYIFYMLGYVFFLVAYSAIDLESGVVWSNLRSATFWFRLVLIVIVTVGLSANINDAYVQYNRTRHKDFVPKLFQVLETNELRVNRVFVEKRTDELYNAVEKYNHDMYKDAVNAYLHFNVAKNLYYSDIDFKAIEEDLDGYVDTLARRIAVVGNRRKKKLKRQIIKIAGGKIHSIRLSIDDVYTKGKANDGRASDMHDRYGRYRAVLLGTRGLYTLVTAGAFAILVLDLILNFKLEDFLTNLFQLCSAIASGFSFGMSLTHYQVSLYTRRNSFYEGYMGITDISKYDQSTAEAKAAAGISDDKKEQQEDLNNAGFEGTYQGKKDDSQELRADRMAEGIAR